MPETLVLEHREFLRRKRTAMAGRSCFQKLPTWLNKQQEKWLAVSSRGKKRLQFIHFPALYVLSAQAISPPNLHGRLQAQSAEVWTNPSCNLVSNSCKLLDSPPRIAESWGMWQYLLQRKSNKVTLWLMLFTLTATVSLSRASPICYTQVCALCYI